MGIFSSPSEKWEKDVNDSINNLVENIKYRYDTALERKNNDEHSYDHCLSCNEYKTVTDLLRVAFSELDELLTYCYTNHDKIGFSQNEDSAFLTKINDFEKGITTLTQITINQNLMSINDINKYFLSLVNRYLSIPCNHEAPDEILRLKWNDVTKSITGELGLTHNVWKNDEYNIWKEKITINIDKIEKILVKTTQITLHRKKNNIVSTDPFLAPDECRSFFSTVRQNTIALQSILQQGFTNYQLLGINSEQKTRCEKLNEGIKLYYKVGVNENLLNAFDIELYTCVLFKNTFSSLNLLPYQQREIEKINASIISHELIMNQDWKMKLENALQKFSELVKEVDIRVNQKSINTDSYEKEILKLKDFSEVVAAYFNQGSRNLDAKNNIIGLSNYGITLCKSIEAYLYEFLDTKNANLSSTQIIDNIDGYLKKILNKDIDILDKKRFSEDILDTIAA